jgi:hypothetical protein
MKSAENEQEWTIFQVHEGEWMIFKVHKQEQMILWYAYFW